MVKRIVKIFLLLQVCELLQILLIYFYREDYNLEDIQTIRQGVKLKTAAVLLPSCCYDLSIL